MRQTILPLLLLISSFTYSFAQATITGELKKWHKITLTFEGVAAAETSTPNPFTDYRLLVNFNKGERQLVVPGYFAADGNAAESGATEGNKWRVHFAPDEEGEWIYTVSFRSGPNVALSDDPEAGLATSFDGETGSFTVGPTDKTGRDHRGKGRLQYVGERYLQFAETGDYFLKVGADAPENFLAYEDFDNTPNNGNRRKDWAPHIQDWQADDPSWGSEKGKGIIGALNYLADEGQNAFSFLTMNINGDDKNVFPYITDNAADRLRMDCSKLDQWEIVFEHADQLGLYLHFKTQETENDQLLDGGALGSERRLYYRELMARFGHHLALNWNMGEENTNTVQQRRDFAQYFRDHDPYQHHIVIHTYPGQHQQVYGDLVGDQSEYTGASVQVGFNQVHQRTLQWVNNAAATGKAWVVANDEQGNAQIGVPHDGYTGSPSQDEIRQKVLWGNLMAGGAGVEYYFGYSLPHSDLSCQDFRSRNQMWDYNRYAQQFFTNFVPFWTMSSHNELIENNNDGNDRYCLAVPGETYLVYLPEGGSWTLDLGGNTNTFFVHWFNPRTGSALETGSLATISGPGEVSMGTPPSAPNQDWAVLITLDEAGCPPEGTPCDDGDPSTYDDTHDGECNCTGLACPAAGTPCDDGNPATENDLENGFCECFGTIPGDSIQVWLEAECALVGANWTIVEDPTAANGYYVLPPAITELNEPPGTAVDKVIFNFSVAQAGTYRIYARTQTTNDGDDSFWVRANSGPWQKWNKVNAANYGPFYQWEQVGNWTSGEASVPLTFDLVAGPNTLEFGRREPLARLDKVFITREEVSLEGSGNEATNCEPVTDTEEIDGQGALQIYPNPASEWLHLKLPEQEQLERAWIVNAQGQVVARWREAMPGEVVGKLPIAHLAAGLYTLKVRTADRDYSTKWVKQ